MESEPNSNEQENGQEPEVMIISRPTVDEQGETRIYLSIVKYDNAIQASLYDRKPKLGSMTLAYPVLESVEKQTIFGGKHDQMSAALALLFVRAADTIVYGSVNLSEHVQVQNEMLREMIAEYTDTLDTTKRNIR